MRLHIPSFVAGTLLGFFLLFGTLNALSQSKSIMNLQGEAIQTTIQIGSETVPATIKMDLEVFLEDIVATTPQPLQEQNDDSNTTGLTIFNIFTDGSPNLIRNLKSPKNTGLNITSPAISFDEETELFTFDEEIGMSLNIHSISAKSKVAGEGIERVVFTVTDSETDKVVYKYQDSSSLYCLFSGDTEEECESKTFVELGNRWSPTGKWIYNGDYNMNIYIETEDDHGDWDFPIRIQGARERIIKTNSYNSYGK